MHPKWHIDSIFLLIEIFTQISVFRLVFFRCHSVSPKWGFHKRFRCPIALPDRLAQLNVLLLCNHIVHYIRLSFLFQSTLPRGERRAYPDRSHMPQNFNPRSHEGSDGHGTASLRRQHNFNPRSHEGSDITGMANVRHQKAFQSALPRGERHHTPRGVSGNAHFNPRSREGSDHGIRLRGVFRE